MNLVKTIKSTQKSISLGAFYSFLLYYYIIYNQRISIGAKFIFYLFFA